MRVVVGDNKVLEDDDGSKEERKESNDTAMDDGGKAMTALRCEKDV